MSQGLNDLVRLKKIEKTEKEIFEAFSSGKYGKGVSSCGHGVATGIEKRGNTNQREGISGTKPQKVQTEPQTSKAFASGGDLENTQETLYLCDKGDTPSGHFSGRSFSPNGFSSPRLAAARAPRVSSPS
jgi:hypothetical protein